MCGEHLLESVDLLGGALVLLLGAESLDGLNHHPAVPGAVEDGDVTGIGHGTGEPPQVGVLVILLRGRLHPGDLIAAGVQGVADVLDGASLPGGVPSLETEDEGASARRQEDLQPLELLAELVHAVVVVGCVLVEFEVLPGIGEAAFDGPALGLGPCVLQADLHALDDGLRGLLHSFLDSLDIDDVPGGALGVRPLEDLGHDGPEFDTVHVVDR